MGKMAIVILAALLLLAGGIYYLVPGPYHILTINGKPYDMQVKHALFCIFLAAVVIVFGRAWAKGSNDSPTVSA